MNIGLKSVGSREHSVTVDIDGSKKWRMSYLGIIILFFIYVLCEAVSRDTVKPVLYSNLSIRFVISTMSKVDFAKCCTAPILIGVEDLTVKLIYFRQ